MIHTIPTTQPVFGVELSTLSIIRTLSWLEIAKKTAKMEIRTKLDNGLLQTYVNMDIFKNKTLASIRKMLQLDIPFDFYFIYRDTICGIHQEHRRKLVHDATVLYVLRKRSFNLIVINSL